MPKDNSACHNESKVASKFEQHHIFRLPHSPDTSPCDFWLFGLLKGIIKDREFHSHEEIKGPLRWLGMTSLLRTFRASSTTGCAALHGSLNMKESVFLNKNEMVSFDWVDVEIGRGAGDFLYTLHQCTRVWFAGPSEPTFWEHRSWAITFPSFGPSSGRFH
jgi:hypothetical protein